MNYELRYPRSLGLLASAGAIVALTSILPQLVGQRPEPRVEQVRGRPAATREVLVQLRESVPAGEMAQLGIQMDVDQGETLNPNGIMRLRSRRFDVETLVSFLQSLPFVEFAEPNYIVSVAATPNDPEFPKQWGLFNTTAPGVDIGAVSAWDVSTGSASQVIGIVDTGIDYSHPDLAANVWRAPATFTVNIGGKAITCAAGTHGFDAVKNTCDPLDDNKHGTHVAGIMGATGNNVAGVVGVNWKVRLMGLKFADQSGSGTMANVVKAIEFAIQAKQIFASTNGADVRVLSNSWAITTYSSALLNQINRANTHNMLFVAAAGNNNTNIDSRPYYPASYAAANVVAVAATTRDDQRALYSNYGAKSVDLGAPGSAILSTIRGGGYAAYSGTSMATAHVSGAAALILSKCEMATAALKTLILDTVTVMSALSGITVTGGRLNVDTAIRACADDTPTDPDPVAPAPPGNLTATGGNAQVALNWSASSDASSYAVKRRTLGSSSFATIAPSVASTSYTDTGVTNGVTYEYVVTAVNDLESEPSNMASATPTLPPAPDATIDLSWDASSSATSYVLKRSLTSGSGYASIASLTVRTYSDRNVQSGTTYYYVVTAVNVDGESGNSNQASARAE